LFKYNTAATGNGSFDETFNNCVKLQLHTQIFCLTGEESTRFLNLSPDFEDCFELDTAFTGTQGTAPELWNFTYGTGTPVTTDCFNGQSLTSITNYASVPTAWK